MPVPYIVVLYESVHPPFTYRSLEFVVYFLIVLEASWSPFLTL